MPGGTRLFGRVSCVEGITRDVYEDPDGHQWVTGAVGRMYGLWLPRRRLLDIAEWLPPKDNHAKSAGAEERFTPVPPPADQQVFTRVPLPADRSLTMEEPSEKDCP
jgi:hypothetical protein